MYSVAEWTDLNANPKGSYQTVLSSKGEIVIEYFINHKAPYRYSVLELCYPGPAASRSCECDAIKRISLWNTEELKKTEERLSHLVRFWIYQISL